MKFCYVTNIFDLHTFDYETTVLKNFFEDIFHNTGQYNKHRNKVSPHKSNVPNDTETGELVCDIIEWVLYDWKHWREVG